MGGGGRGEGGEGVRKLNINGEGRFCGYFFGLISMHLEDFFFKFEVENGNTFCRYLNLIYFLGMPDIPDIFFILGGGGGGVTVDA